MLVVLDSPEDVVSPPVEAMSDALPEGSAEAGVTPAKSPVE
jgi:hypothetical protein